MTVTVQIGNSDDRLTQVEWSKFCVDVDSLVRCAGQLHFHGCSAGDGPWQNACWVLELNGEGWEPEYLRIICGLEEIRKRFRQESVAVTVGETQFV